MIDTEIQTAESNNGNGITEEIIKTVENKIDELISLYHSAQETEQHLRKELQEKTQRIESLENELQSLHHQYNDLNEVKGSQQEKLEKAGIKIKEILAKLESVAA